MKVFLIATAAVLSAALPARAQDVWNLKKPGPENVLHAVAAAGGYLYAFGGFAYGPPGATFRYDPVEDSWATLPDMPAEVWGTAAASANGIVYAFGNAASKNGAIYGYNPLIGSWTTLTVTLTGGRYYAGAATVADRIYICGGETGSGPSALVDEFDPATGRITPKSPLPGAATYAPAVAAARGKVYVAGGFRGVSLTSCAEYDPATDAWTARADMPEGRHWGACFGARGRLYVVGGWYSSSAMRETTYEFAPASNSWTRRADLPYGGRYMFGGAAINGRGYAYGGEANDINGYSACCEYVPPVFGTPPSAPTGLFMALPDGTPADEGATVGRAGIRLGADLADPDAADQVALEVEIVPDGQAFRGAPTLTSAAGPAGSRTVLLIPAVSGAWRWACRAVDQDENYSAWVEFETPGVDFRTDLSEPAVPSPIGPDGVDVPVRFRSGSPVLLSWTASTDDSGAAPAYEIEFSGTVIPAAGTSLEVVCSPSATAYPWRVRAIDAAGNASAWSRTASFRVYLEDGIDHGAGDAWCSAGGRSGGWTAILMAILVLSLRRRA